MLLRIETYLLRLYDTCEGEGAPMSKNKIDVLAALRNEFREGSQKPQDERKAESPRDTSSELSPESLYRNRTYISNCIFRIMVSPCSPANEQRRAEDLAGALYHAEALGLDNAHRYLIRLCDAAETGKYTEAS